MLRCLSAMLVAGAILLTAAPGASASPSVSVFPSPGTQYAAPGEQIVFRGIAPNQIGNITVVGSRTGTHTGHFKDDSDGQGASFFPDKQFAPGETVTVKTGLNIVGAGNGTFHFKIDTPFGNIGPETINFVPAGAHGVTHYRSRPDLLPAAVSISSHGAPASDGDIFVAPQIGPGANGPELLAPNGSLIWFHPLGKNMLATDFRVQHLHNQPVLTWWQGYTNHGSGRGEGIIFNKQYKEIDVVKAADGLQGVDLHEFLITNSGDAYIVVESPVKWQGQGRPLMNSTVQEIDIKTGLELFEWDALDHVPVSESFFPTLKSQSGYVYDPYHMNSIAIDTDGNLIVSMRNTWASYKINHQSGAVMWTLGSKRSSFKMGNGASTAFQHDVEVQPNGDLTEFDDGAGPPVVHSESRGIEVSVNTGNNTATLVKQYVHTPPIVAIFEGSMQILPGGDVFLGWGSDPHFSEYTSSGQQDLDGRFIAGTDSYRAYRFPWSAQPPTTPALALSRGADGVTSLYASWNGATDVSSWRVLAGSDSHHLSQIGAEPKTGFETVIRAHNEQPYFEVQALSSSGKVLATSSAAGSTATRMSVFGHSAFIHGGGGGLFVGCFSSKTCHVKTTLSAGKTVISSTGSEAIQAGKPGNVFFTLTSAGQSMLAHARGGQLPASATVRNFDGATTSTDLNLIPYSVSGKAPAYSVKQGRTVQIYDRSVFVSRSGVGGVYVGCSASQPCHTVTTITVGNTTIARTGSEFVGAGDYGTDVFNLTSTGLSMLVHAPGNQLAATVSVSNGHDAAVAHQALIRFG
jgi:Arylsulfotransferase (ASST)